MKAENEQILREMADMADSVIRIVEAEERVNVLLVRVKGGLTRVTVEQEIFRPALVRVEGKE